MSVVIVEEGVKNGQQQAQFRNEKKSRKHGFTYR